MAENLVRVLMGRFGGRRLNFEFRISNEETRKSWSACHSSFWILNSKFEIQSLSSALDLSPLDFVRELQNPVHQSIGRRRAAGNPDVDGDDLVDALSAVVGA